MPRIPRAGTIDEEEDAREWGSWLRARRKDLGLTQAQLAIMIGVNRTTISRFELGRAFPNVNNSQGLEDAQRLRRLLS